MGKSAPEPPDYEAAAVQQGEVNEAVNRAQTYANRPTQITPWGTTYWTPGVSVDPSSGENVTTWTQQQDLTPLGQEALDAQQQVQTRLSNVGSGLLGRVEQEFGAPMQWGNLYDMQRAPEASDATRRAASDARYQMMTRRLDPMWQQREQAQEMRLRAQGLRPGDAAYDTAMSNLGQARDDAYQNAMNQAITQGGQEMALQHGLGMRSAGFDNQLRQQQIAEAMQRRGFSLNEINAILHGQQVQAPQMPNFSQAQRAEAAPLYQAAQSQWQADMDRASHRQQAIQGLMSGMTSLGVGAMTGGMVP